MRRILPLFYGVAYRVCYNFYYTTAIISLFAHQLRDALQSSVESGKTEHDFLSWAVRVALELIGQGGLGYSFDPLTEDKRDAYADAIKAFK